MKHASSFVRAFGRVIVQVVAPVLLIAVSMQAAHATSGATEALEGMWCSEDAKRGATIVQYSAAGSDITTFTVLSEADPRRIGAQSSMHLTAEAPNVFSRRSFDGAEEILSVHSGRLTVNSLRIWNRGTRDETRQVLDTQTYHRCDVGQALRRAQAFLSSPKAEEATRLALQRDADAELEKLRNASKDAYYAGLIRQLNQARFAR